MYINNLALTNFRNIESAELLFDNHFNIIYGNNGNGKTNLLESIHYISNLKPLKDNYSNHLIMFNKTSTQIETTIKTEQEENHLKIILSNEGKKIFLNQNQEKQIQDYLFDFKSVIFTPDDLVILKGEPEKRRKHFDKAIFHTQPAYFKILKDYEQVLKNRTALIKDMVEKGVASSEQKKLFEVYNNQFSKLSCQVYQQREKYLIDYIPYFINTVKKLSDNKINASLNYYSNFDYSNEKTFLADLEKNFKEEINKKRTLCGPHLDDYIFLINDKNLRTYGSQGEIRSFLLALKTAHILYLYQLSNNYPVLLLDDMSSELDNNRKKFLFDFLSSIQGQVFITTTHKEHIILNDNVSRNYFNINEGLIIKE